MRWMLVGIAALVGIGLVGCDCDISAPESWGGGRQVGWWVEDDGGECATYRTLWCDYTVCREAQMCGPWSLAEWYCW